GGHRAEGGGGVAAPAQVAQAVDQADDHVAYGLARLRPVGVVGGTEQRALHAGGDQCAEREDDGGGHQQRGGALRVGTEDEAQDEARAAPDEGEHGARGGGDGVGHHEPVGGDDVRQGRAEGGQEEAVDAEHAQRGEVEPRLRRARYQQGGGDRQQHASDDRGDDEDLPP